MASLVNGVFILGMPAEMLYFGPVYRLLIFRFFPMSVGLGIFILPTIHRLKLSLRSTWAMQKLPNIFATYTIISIKNGVISGLLTYVSWA